MKRWRWPFGGLYWRLTISYFLVTLVAVLTVEIAVTLGSLLQDYTQSGVALALDAALQQEAAPQIATYLERSPADQTALNGWAWSTLFQVQLPVRSVIYAAVLDRDGQMLASAADPGTPTQGLLAAPASQAVLSAALAGDQQPNELMRTLPDGQTVFAVPIQRDDLKPGGPGAPADTALGAFFAIGALQSEPEPKAISFLLAPYLEQVPPNRDALSGWVWAMMNISRGSAQDATALGNRDVAAVQILDQQGRALASAIAARGNGQDALTSTQAQAAIHAALTGQRRAVDLSGGAPGGQTVAATPLLSYDGHQLGVLAIVVNRPGPLARSGLAFLVGDFFSRLQPQGFLFLLLATVVGTLTGVFISRSLSQRLRRITRAADDWSRGDLQVEVRDRARDELGQLARRLNAMAEQLQRLLSTRQELAVVEERNRLARELHDSVKQQVFATALLVRSARKQLARSPDAAAERLAEAEALAGQTQAELTILIRALRPAAIADKGLVAVLRDFASDWSRHTGIQADLRIQGERATPLEIEEALYRVAQEALANVARHSEATAVELRLVWEGDTLQLAIRDNGTGFDPARAEGKGLGLASMRERVEALNGSLTIDSAPGATVVEARVPMAASGAAEAMEAAKGV